MTPNAETNTREDVRLDMLEEAVAVMRELWAGGFVYHYGRSANGRRGRASAPVRR
jgi:hypothetical protein